MLKPATDNGSKLPDIVGKLNTALHVCVVATSLSIAFACFDSTLFGWHPLFMSIGYLLFMTEGLISAVMFRHLDGPERVKAIQGHALLQLRAFLCIAVGFGVIFRNKCGLAAIMLSAISPIWGLVSFRKMGLIQKFPEVLQPRIKAWHRRVGIITWLLALVTIELALPHPAVFKGLLTRVWQVTVATLGAMVLTLMIKARVKAKAEDVIAKAV